MHNSTELEKLGVPSVAIVTEPFKMTAESMAKRRGFPNYRYVLVQHPLSSATPEQVKDRAAKALGQIEAIVLGDVHHS